MKNLSVWAKYGKNFRLMIDILCLSIEFSNLLISFSPEDKIKYVYVMRKYSLCLMFSISTELSKIVFLCILDLFTSFMTANSNFWLWCIQSWYYFLLIFRFFCWSAITRHFFKYTIERMEIPHFLIKDKKISILGWNDCRWDDKIIFCAL